MIQITNANLNARQKNLLNTITLGEYLFDVDSLEKAKIASIVEMSLVRADLHKRVTFTASEDNVRNRINDILERHGEKTIQPHSRILLPILM